MKRDVIVAGVEADVCETFLERARGLIGRPAPAAGHGLLIPKCNAIHTWFMRYPIDATFLDAEGKVVRKVKDIRPWRTLIWGGFCARSVLETASKLSVVLLMAAVGCVSVDRDALQARVSLDSANSHQAVEWSEDLANESFYSKNLGLVEAGRVRLLRGETAAAETYFRRAVDSAVDRKEKEPKIKLGDVGNTFLASTITDDRTREYYLAPYEINLALEYGILAQLFNGRREDALADARLAVYMQDSLAKTYGADVGKNNGSADAKAKGAADGVYRRESSKMASIMEGTRNSWENPALWWLTGVLFEASGDSEMAWQSYRKAYAVKQDNPVFAADAMRADVGVCMPRDGNARLVVIYEEGFVPMRTALKVPVPIYTGMSIDLPLYRDAKAYAPSRVSISGAEKLIAAAPAVNVRALAARDLDEHLPGIILRNVTRAAVQAGAQAAVNANGNEYAQVAVFLGNVVVSAFRSADTRSWITLPDGQQVWQETAMKPGEYQLGVNVDGRTVSVPVSLKPGETKVVWIVDTGKNFHYLVSQ